MAYATLAQFKSYWGIKNSDTFTAAAGTDILTLTSTAIDWVTGSEVVVSNSGGALPGGLSASTIYYVIYKTPLTIQLATTESNANSGTQIDITGAGTGTHTISKAITDDDLLEDLLDRVTARIEIETSRNFEAETKTNYYDSSAYSTEDHLLYLSDDLLTITTLTNGDSDATEIPDTEYRLLPRNEGPPYWSIKLHSDSTYYWEWDTDGWVSVAGTWGYSATPPDDIVEACLEWTAYTYRLRDSQVFDVSAFPVDGVIQIPKGIPLSVRLALEPYVKRVL